MDIWYQCAAYSDSKPDSDGNSLSDTNTNDNSDRKSNSDRNTNIDSNGNTHSNADNHTYTDRDRYSNRNANTYRNCDSDSNADSDTNGDSNSNTHRDSDSRGHTNCDGFSFANADQRRKRCDVYRDCFSTGVSGYDDQLFDERQSDYWRRLHDEWNRRPNHDPSGSIIRFSHAARVDRQQEREKRKSGDDAAAGKWLRFSGEREEKEKQSAIGNRDHYRLMHSNVAEPFGDSLRIFLTNFPDNDLA